MNNYLNMDRSNASAQAFGASGNLEFGRVYTGVITATSHGDNLYEVSVDKISVTITCRWAAGIFSPLLGIRMNYFPPVQSRVAVVYNKDGPSWIIGSLPGEPYDLSAGAAMTMTGMGDEELPSHEAVSDGSGLSSTKPNDLLEGEFEITNNFGVAVQFLTTVLKMKASERAKIEASLLDDMVRIVSETFKHFSSFGDFQIYNDGRLNVRWDGTSYEHEAFGKMEATDPKVELDDKKVDFQDKYNETGRWRFSQFVGFLGDFIHVFVTEPADALSNIASEALRPGKARVHVHNDGTILMQSVSEIVLERVCRVIVPIEKKRFDDPEGNKKDEFEDLEKDFLKLWDYGTDMKRAHYASYQLRQYGRWLSCYHSYARFHQLDKEWRIPTETEEGTEHTYSNQEEDVENINSGKDDAYDAYATIRIFRDGSILIMDHHGSAVSMVRGNIQISASRHIDLDAAGDIRITAGQNIYMKARRNIEISAIVGGLTLKARTWWKALCEWGSVWIKSDALDPLKAAPPGPVDTEQDPKAEQRAGAVVIESSNGQMILQSARRMTISAIGQPDDPASMTDTTASVLLQSRSQDVCALGNRNVVVKAEGANEGILALDAGPSSTIIKCQKLLTNAKIFDIDKKFTWKNRRLDIAEIRAERSHISTYITGPEMKGTDLADDQIPYKFHGHHMWKYDPEATPVEYAEAEDTEDLDNYESISEVKPHTDNGDPADGPDWAYVEEDKKFDESGYTNDPKQDEIFQPHAQQRLAETGDDEFIKKDDYDLWDWASDNKLKSGTRTKSDSLPFPGKNAQEKVSDDGEPLHRPLSSPYSAQTADKGKDPVDEDIKRKFLKYKP